MTTKETALAVAAVYVVIEFGRYKKHREEDPL